MNLPLFLPGMHCIIITCFCMIGSVAAAIYFTRHKYKSPKSGKHRIIFALSVFAFIAVYILLYTVSSMIGRFQVQSQLAKMREQGIPLEKDLVLPKMPENTSDNGAYFYKAAFNLMNASPSFNIIDEMYRKYTYYKHIDAVAEWSEQDRKTVRQILTNEDIKLIINLFRRGAEKPCAVYEHQYNGSDTLLPELNPQRELFRLVRIQSFCEGLDGNPESGYRLLHDGFKVINQFKSEAFVISQWVNISCVSINIDGMNELVFRYGITEPSARQLLAELEKLDFNQAMIHGLDGDIMIWRDDIFKKIINGEKVRCIDPLGKNMTDIILGEFEVCGWWPFFYQDYAHYLERMNKIRNWFTKPYWIVENEIKVIQDENKYLEYRLITKRLINGLVTIRTKTANIESEINAAKLTLALHIYKNQHGDFPYRLEQLAPEILKEIPVDPINGKPFEYQKTGNAFTLSSVWLKEKEQKRLDDAKRMKTNQATPK